MNKIQGEKEVEPPSASPETEVAQRPARVCWGCGAEEQVTDFGGVRYSTVAPYNQLCFECARVIANECL